MRVLLPSEAKMAEITGSLQDAWAVEIVESERGWGSKVDSVKYFDTYDSAAAYVKEFNAANVGDEVPDWYMVAQSPKLVKIVKQSS